MFDTEFDYTETLSAFTNNVVNLTTNKTELQSNKNSLSASTYADLIAPEIAIIEDKINNLTTKITSYQALIDEIHFIQSRPDSDKALAYYFYTMLGVPKSMYMIKMLFNSQLLFDTNVMRLYNDASITDPNLKIQIARILYDRFAINNTYSEIYEISRYV
jgi:hypothetical protein